MAHPLQPLVGTWATVGQTRPTEDRPAVPIAGTDTYEWLVENAIVLHRVDVHVGDEHVGTCEIIGPSAKPGEYFMHAYDQTGDAGSMTAIVSARQFRFEGPSLRFTGSLTDDDQKISGLWELRPSADGPWTPWMDIELTRRDAPVAP